MSRTFVKYATLWVWFLLTGGFFLLMLQFWNNPYGLLTEVNKISTYIVGFILLLGPSILFVSTVYLSFKKILLAILVTLVFFGFEFLLVMLYGGGDSFTRSFYGNIFILYEVLIVLTALILGVIVRLILKNEIDFRRLLILFTIPLVLMVVTVWRVSVYQNVSELMCGQMTDFFGRAGCYKKLAIERKDPSWCYAIEPQQFSVSLSDFDHPQVTECLKQISSQVTKREICMKISNQVSARKCLLRVSDEYTITHSFTNEGSNYKTTGTVILAVGSTLDVWGGRYFLRLNNVQKNNANFSVLSDNKVASQFNIALGQKVPITLPLMVDGQNHILTGTISFDEIFGEGLQKFKLILDSNSPRIE